MPHSSLVGAVVVALAVGCSTLSAQSLQPSGPTMAAARAGVQMDAAPAAVPATVATHAALRNSEKLMILGGAALITGAIIGDTPGTIIMVGGAVVGLYGLYLFLDRPHGVTGDAALGVGYAIPLGN